MRRFVIQGLTLSLSLSLLLGLGAVGTLNAQEEAPPSQEPEESPQDTPKADAAETPQEPAPAEDEPEPEAPASAETNEIPAEVQEKLEAARKAVAEAIVAAERAGLVQTNLTTPPILDVLITGRATDKTEVEAANLGENPEVQVGLRNPEAFAAYFTGHANLPEEVDLASNIRILDVSQGLKAFFDLRAEVMAPYLETARQETTSEAEAPAPAETPAEVEPSDKPAEEMKKEEEPKAEEPKKEPKAEEPKEEPKAEEPKEEPKTEEPKEEPKAEEPKEEPKVEDKPSDPSPSEEPK